MASALDVVKRSMRLIRVLGAGEEPTDSEAQDGLTAMNSMLDAWAVEKLMVYQTRQENFTWPGATVSRTIGATGNFATTRPIEIEGGFTRDSGSNDISFRVISREAYDSLPGKSSAASSPEYLFYDPGYALGTIYLYGVPSSSLTLFINSRLQFTQAASLSATVAFPPGYKRAIEYNLATEYAAEFNQPIPPDVARIAVESKRAIKGLNQRVMISQIEFAGGRRASILNG